MTTESTTWVMVTRRGSDARATIADVAREAGVNKGTVSRALRGHAGVGNSTRARIFAVADRLEFSASHTATALATGMSKTVGIVLPTLSSWYFSEVAAAASGVLIAAGFRVELINLDTESEMLDVTSVAFRQLFRELGAGRGRDALLFAGTIAIETGTPDTRFAKVPASLAGLPLTSVPGIFVDNHRGGRLVGEHLIQLGHRRIAVLDGRPAGLGTGAMWQRRTDGLLEALRSAGVSPESTQILGLGDCRAEDGAEAMETLLRTSEHTPTAVFCHCDQMAFGALSVLRRRGLRCPEDISIAAFDDHPMSKFWGLTTVTQHARQQGTRSAAALLAAMGAADPQAALETAPEALDVQLLVRETTGPVSG
ncbi:MAG: LacI family DNA-binding transcriptional regulator [Propionibacteriaceae bacterium]